MDVVIVDCGIGNIRSVQRMFEAVGGNAEVVTDPDSAFSCKRLVLPGVGAFDAGMRALQENGWLDVLNHIALERRVPVLGICLGMQLLCRRSEEGTLPGLGWIDADVVVFDSNALPNLKIPHMGWAPVNPVRENPLIPNDKGLQRFYHVHKYHAVCDRKESVLATAHYGIDFTTGVCRDNIYGVQFHPEKSHRFGMGLMRRFLDMPC